MPKHTRLDAEHAFVHQLRRFGSPPPVVLWAAILLPLGLCIAMAVLQQPVTVPTCYTTDQWNWENLPCLANASFSLSELSLESSGRCSCVLDEGYRYYIGGPTSALECGLSLCVYLDRHSEQGYLFRTCSWEDGAGNETTMAAELLPDGAGIFVDQSNTDILCAGAM